MGFNVNDVALEQVFSLLIDSLDKIQCYHILGPKSVVSSHTQVIALSEQKYFKLLLFLQRHGLLVPMKKYVKYKHAKVA
jgi:hypothetical protein